MTVVRLAFSVDNFQVVEPSRLHEIDVGPQLHRPDRSPVALAVGKSESFAETDRKYLGAQLSNVCAADNSTTSRGHLSQPTAADH
jgi:hypothetical protein